MKQTAFQKRIVFLLLALFTHLLSIGQDSIQDHLILKLHPLAAIDPGRPTIQGSVEVAVMKKWSVEFTYGRKYTFNYHGDTITVVHPWGQMIKCEIKLYFKTKEQNSTSSQFARFYVGPGFWYIHEHDNLGNGGIHVKNRVFAFNIGAIAYYSRFSVDVSFNAGFRFKERTFENINPPPPISQDFINGVGQAPSYSYNGVLPHIGLAVRFGWIVF